jgi:hypothetical protein
MQGNLDKVVQHGKRADAKSVVGSPGCCASRGG